MIRANRDAWIAQRIEALNDDPQAIKEALRVAFESSSFRGHAYDVALAAAAGISRGDYEPLRYLLGHVLYEQAETEWVDAVAASYEAAA